jgi:hypothetical protein
MSFGRIEYAQSRVRRKLVAAEVRRLTIRDSLTVTWCW